MYLFCTSIEYFIAVQKILTNYNPMCEFRIRQANKMIGNLIKTDYGVKYIQKKFKYVAIKIFTNIN